MKLSEIVVGDEYAIRWGGGIIRGEVTYAGRDRRYIVSDRVMGSRWTTGARVFFHPVRGYKDGAQTVDRSTEMDAPSGSVVRPWARQAKLNEAKATVEAGYEATRSAAEKALGSPVQWHYRFDGKVSRTLVTVDLEALLKALGVDR